MASSGKRKTTMAKLTRERRLIERRLDKQAKKAAKKHSAAHQSAEPSDSTPGATDPTSQPIVEQGAPEVVMPAPPSA